MNASVQQLTDEEKRQRLLERKRFSQSAWRAKNLETARAIVRAWQAKNPEKARAASRAWKKQNRKKVQAGQRAWRKKNPEKFRASVKRWCAKNPEKMNAIKRRSRARAGPTSRRRASENLMDGFVRHSLRNHTHLCAADIPTELVELKRAHLKLLRLVKSLMQRNPNK